jgi:hypothetical protein
MSMEAGNSNIKTALLKAITCSMSIEGSTGKIDVLFEKGETLVTLMCRRIWRKRRRDLWNQEGTTLPQKG